MKNLEQKVIELGLRKVGEQNHTMFTKHMYRTKKNTSVEVSYHMIGEHYTLSVNGGKQFSFKTEKGLLKGMITRLEKIESPTIEEPKVEKIALNISKNHLSEKDLKDTVEKLFKHYGIKNTMQVKVNNRLSRALGRFGFTRRYGKIEPQFIDFAKIITQIPSEHAMQIVLHEVAHVIQYLQYGTKTQPHGKEFKQICKEIGCHQDRPTIDGDVMKAVHDVQRTMPRKPLIG